MPAKYATEFNAWVAREGHASGSVGFGALNLNDLMKRIFHHATFLMGQNGARVVVSENCIACHGTGVMKVNSRKKNALCKFCKGATPVEIMNVVVTPSEECVTMRYTEVTFKGDRCA